MATRLTPQARRTMEYLSARPGWHSVPATAEAVGAAPSGIGRTLGVLIRRGLAVKKSLHGVIVYSAAQGLR
jgi:hypothetical protein